MTPLRSPRSLLMVLLFALLGSFVTAIPALATDPEPISELTTGNLSLGASVNPDTMEWELPLKDESQISLAADSTVLRVGDDRHVLTRADDAQADFGPAGSDAWVSAASQVDPTTIGVRLFGGAFPTRALVGGRDAVVSISLAKVEGPGDYLTYVASTSTLTGTRPAGTGQDTLLGTGVDRSGTPRTTTGSRGIRDDSSIRRVSRFTAPGMYCVTYAMDFTLFGATSPTHVENTLRWAVGDAVPADAPCGTPATETGLVNHDPGADPGPQPWNVPNWSPTVTGARILNDGHIDVASILSDGLLDTRIKDTTVEGAKYATSEGAYWHDPAQTVMQLLPGSQTTVPADDTYRFLGKANRPIWVLGETQQDDLLWPGWSTQSIPVDDTTGGIDWKLDRISGPGDFALYQSGQTLGSVNVLFNTRDGITAADSTEIAKNTHAHGSWAFSAEGTYCLGFTRSATLTDGEQPVSTSFNLAVAVGRVAVRTIDPSACFASTDRPATADAAPVQESRLTGATTGEVGLASSGSEVTAGQTLPMRAGRGHAGQWVSVWWHSDPTWLGWAQVAEDGTAQVQAPATVTPGDHKVSVQTPQGELVGWFPVTVLGAAAISPPPPAPAPNAPVVRARYASKTTLALKRGRAVVRVRVSGAPAGFAVNGTVVIRDGNKIVGRGKVVNGVARIRLSKKASRKGVHRLRARYSGSTTGVADVTGSLSRTLTYTRKRAS